MAFFEVTNLFKSFGGLAAVNGVSFRVEKGQTFGLIGPNGSGKTTVFNLINGFFRPDRGEILFEGRKISRLKTHQICRLGIARTFQVVKPLKRMTVLDNVMASTFLRAESRRAAKTEAIQIVEQYGLGQYRDRMARSLPIELRKRLEVARAMATKPKLLMLDETSAGLNPSELEHSIALIAKIKAAGVTIIIVEHIMKMMMTVSDRILCINHGTPVAEGTPEEVASNPEVIAAYLGEDYVAGS